MMSYNLPPTVYTLDQLQVGALELRQFASRLSGRAAGHRPATDESPLGAESQALLGQLPKAKQADAAAIGVLAAEVEGLVAHGPRVAVTLAGLPSHRLREELVRWLRTNVKANLLVDFHINPDIGGGIVVRTTNRVYDSSFRRQLLNNPARFTKALDRV